MLTFSHRAVMTGASAIALTMGLAGMASAQTASTSTRAEEAGQVAEVVVTATKRTETIQKVAAAVSSFNSEQLAKAGIQDTQSLQTIAPSLVTSVAFSENSGVQIRLRGIGTGGSQLGFEGSVGAFIDGIYRSRPGTAFNDLVDVERVEVLRGPQGTLFGKNTSAGTINIITARPTFDFSGNARLSYGNRNAVLASGAVSGALIPERVAGRLSFSYNKADGYIKDPVNGKDHNDRNRYTVRGQLLVLPTPQSSLRLIADYSRKDEDCCLNVYTTLGTGATNALRALGGVIELFDNVGYVNGANTPTLSEAVDYGYTAEYENDFGWADFKLLAGYRRYIGDQVQDGEWSNVDISRQEDHTRNRFYSVEPQLNGVWRNVDWLVGAYYFNDSIVQNQPTTLGTQAGAYFNLLSGGTVPASRYPAGGGDTVKRNTQDTEGWSVFSHNIITVTPKLKATIGVRYLQEEKTGSLYMETDGAPITSAPLPARCAPPTPASLRVLCPQNSGAAEYSDSSVSGTFGLSYQATPEILIFTNLSNGYKGGGISAARDAYGPVPGPVVLSSATFKPETVDSAEIGIKARLFDRRLTINVTGFRAEYSDFQIQTRDVTTATTIVSNAATVSQSGVEFEMFANPMRGLFLNLSGTNALSKYGDDTFDLTLRGKRLGNAPKGIVQGGAEYNWPLSDDWAARINGNFRWMSDVNANSTLNALLIQDAYTVYNARFEIRRPASGLSLALWGRNLSDEFYAGIYTPQPVQAGSFGAFPAEPRTYGVEVRKSF